MFELVLKKISEGPSPRQGDGKEMNPKAFNTRLD